MAQALAITEEWERGSLKSGSFNKLQDDVEVKVIEPPATATWPTVTILLIADVVGTGILQLAPRAAALGWVPFLVLLLLFWPLNYYTGILLHKCAMDLSQQGGRIFSYAVLAERLWGPRAKLCIGVFIYLKIWITLADYLLAVGNALGGVFYDAHLCLPVWTALAVGLILPLHMFRNLASLQWLGWANAISVIAVVFICTIHLIVNGRAEHVQTYMFAPNTFLGTFKAITGIVFVYAAQYIYLEIFSEMRRPQDFPKALRAAGPYQVGMYAYTSGVCYYYMGTGVASFLTRVIKFGPAYRLVSALLLFHVMVTYLIKGLVLVRALHLAVDPKRVNEASPTASLQWLSLTLLTLGGSYLVGNLVPFFEDLSGLIGAVVSCPSVLTLPIIFYWTHMYKSNQRISTIHLAFSIALFLFSVMIIIFGVYANVQSIVSKSGTYGPPLSCHCENMWNTCHCSPKQMPAPCV